MIDDRGTIVTLYPGGNSKANPNLYITKSGYTNSKSVAFTSHPPANSVALSGIEATGTNFFILIVII